LGHVDGREGDNGLLCPVVQNGEVLGPETSYWLPLTVENRDIELNDIGSSTEGRGLSGGPLLHCGDRAGQRRSELLCAQQSDAQAEKKCDLADADLFPASNAPIPDWLSDDPRRVPEVRRHGNLRAESTSQLVHNSYLSMPFRSTCYRSDPAESPYSG
jgi:hypothetical protein